MGGTIGAIAPEMVATAPIVCTYTSNHLVLGSVP